MQLPKKVRVQNKVYAVIKVKRAQRKSTLGTIDHTHGIIWIATHDGFGKKLHKEEMYDTFWHELTHAILHDMREETLCNDEKFVTNFANRLSCSINTAEL